MPHNEYLCGHKQIVDDERGGCSVCVQCGLVLEEQLFTPNYNELYFEKEFENKNLKGEEEIKELLHRINLPDSYTDQISKNCFSKSKSTKLIPYIIYKTLNEDGCHISIKEISSVSGISNSQIYKKQEKDKVLISKPELMLEKYCCFFNLDFHAYTVIKKQIEEASKTGHNPLTICAAHIYEHTKKSNCKISMKVIARELKISCISIQRYLKIKNKKLK